MWRPISIRLSQKLQQRCDRPRAALHWIATSNFRLKRSTRVAAPATRHTHLRSHSTLHTELSPTNKHCSETGTTGTQPNLSEWTKREIAKCANSFLPFFLKDDGVVNADSTIQICSTKVPENVSSSLSFRASSRSNDTDFRMPMKGRERGRHSCAKRPSRICIAR